MLSITIQSMECKSFFGVKGEWDSELIVAELRLKMYSIEEEPVPLNEEDQRELPVTQIGEPLELYIVAETDTYSDEPDLYYATYESRIAKLSDDNINEDYGTILEMHHDSHGYLCSLYKEFYKIAVNMMQDMFMTKYTPKNM